MAITSASATTTGAFLPDGNLGAAIIRPVQKLSVAFDPRVATPVSTPAHTFRIPVVDSDSSASWLDEMDDVTVGDPVLDEVAVTPSKVGCMTLVSSEFAHDAGSVGSQALGQSLGRALAQQIDEAFFASETAKGPKGLLSCGAPRVETGGWTDLDPIADAIASVRAGGGNPTVLVVDPAIAKTLSKLKTGTGSNQPLLGVDATNAGAQTVLGLPMVVVPTLSPAYSWVLDASAIYTVLNTDVNLVVDSSYAFGKDALALRATARVGFGFVDNYRVCLISDNDGVSSS